MRPVVVALGPFLRFVIESIHELKKNNGYLEKVREIFFRKPQRCELIKGADLDPWGGHFEFPW